MNEQPFALHATAQRHAACGYDRDLRLTESEAQGIASRLRGIQAIACIFVAAGDRDALELDGWLRSGLADAVEALAGDAYVTLERSKERAHGGKT